MTDEQIAQVMQAAQDAWQAIQEWAREVIEWVVRTWKAIPRKVRRVILLRTQPIMRRKIRRYALVYARR